jgi:hypothetical protein
MEKAIHLVLDNRHKHIETAPGLGKKWYMTSPHEVEEIATRNLELS